MRQDDMRKKGIGLSRLFLVVLTVVAVGSLAVLALPYYWDRNNDFWHALESRLKDGSLRVPVAEITAFEWDTVCVLPPYALNVGRDTEQRLKTYIDGELGEFRKTLPKQDHDGAWAFAFIKNGQVVSIQEKGRSLYLRVNYRDNCIPRSQAVFTRDGDYVSIND